MSYDEDEEPAHCRCRTFIIRFCIVVHFVLLLPMARRAVADLEYTMTPMSAFGPALSL